MVCFLLYIHNLSYQINVDKIVQFVDDTTLVSQADFIKNLEIKSFIDSNITSQYFAENISYYNINTNNICGPWFMLGENDIEKAQSAKLLGCGY